VNKALWSQIKEKLEETKARDIVVLDVRKLSSMTDFIIIATGSSDRQVRAIGEYLRENVGKPFSTEGAEEGRWVLMDYFDVVVHIFQDELRRYYDIEGMWLNAKRPI
jgi:ribosome silencing factor RsfS/YbeB/iojap